MGVGLSGDFALQCYRGRDFYWGRVPRQPGARREALGVCGYGLVGILHYQGYRGTRDFYWGGVPHEPCYRREALGVCG